MEDHYIFLHHNIFLIFSNNLFVTEITITEYLTLWEVMCGMFSRIQFLPQEGLTRQWVGMCDLLTRWWPKKLGTIKLGIVIQSIKVIIIYHVNYVIVLQNNIVLSAGENGLIKQLRRREPTKPGCGGKKVGSVPLVRVGAVGMGNK